VLVILNGGKASVKDRASAGTNMGIDSTSTDAYGTLAPRHSNRGQSCS
jgi:hypothetical protein